MVLYTFNNRIAEIRLNRADKRNALNGEMVKALIAALQLAEQDRAKITVISGEGPAFCAGADLDHLQQLQINSFDDNLKDSRQLAELFQLISLHPSVVIARIHGSAIAGGCGLATVCDFSVAAKSARFGYTEVRIGFVPAIVMVYLQNKIGGGRTRELLLSGRIFDADEAAALGLINKAVPDEELDATLDELIGDLLSSNSAQSISSIKQMLVGIQGRSLAESLEYAAGMNARARETDDCKRGISAFLNKEKISW